MRHFLLSALVLSMPLTLLAHGEDKPGPHGGFIRMPGGFHTEVSISKDKLSVYLLDINWKNPSIKDSTVKVDYVQNSKLSSLTCEASKTSFSCILPKEFNSNEGTLVVKAKREGMRGAAAEYPLPLGLINHNNETKEHSDHH